MTNIVSLITQGKSAVEAELARIEGDLSKAKNLAVADSAALAAGLQAYLDSHAAEVATAQALIAKATAIVTPAVESIVTNTVPAKTLNKASTEASKIKTWFTSLTWKQGAALGAVLVIAHYMVGKFL